MKLVGKCNLFVRIWEKDGKKYHFPELSVSSKDQDGKYSSMNVKCRFGKDVPMDGLDDNKCYQINVTDSIVNVKYDDYKKANVMEVFIVDFDFEKEISFKQKENLFEQKEAEQKKNPFTKKK